MAGRVLSKKNETTLRAALEAIGAVLSALDEDEGGDEGGKAKEGAGAVDAVVDSDGDPAVVESAVVGDFVPLVEAAVRGDGTALIKVIQSGWGSSAFYPAEVLKRDGPQVFRAGVKMHWDHQTATEEAERPEGSLTTLAGELISDARWQDSGQAGPGLYADAKVFGPYQEAVNELAPHIGVSIRASGRTKQGEAEGRKGPILEQLVAARSCDFVVTPGAGGKIIQMFESARNGARPAVAAQIDMQLDQGGEMDKESETKFSEMQAANQKRIDDLAAENARMREGLILRDAREAVREALAAVTVPDVTRARLLESLSANPPVTEGALDREALATKVTETVKAEQTYLAEAAGYGSGRITGMGGAAAEPDKAEDTAARMKEAFGRLGLSAEESEIAARGRGY